MNGLATRKAIHDAVIGDVPHLPQLDAAKPSPHASVARTVAGYTAGYNEISLGTPGHEYRRAVARRLATFRKWFWAGMAVALVLGVILVGTNILRPRPPAPVNHDNYHYRQRATHLAVGKSIYVTDPYENCLVGMHKDGIGQVSVSTHC